MARNALPPTGRRAAARDLGVIFLLALAVRLATAWPMRDPGYTDAYYYAVGARQLDAGRGFAEPFIWNYVDPPAAVPHPGYLYWMPLAAIVGWLGMAVLGPSFQALQAPFVLLAALLAPVTYAIAWDLTGERRHARLAGLLAVFPGFYAHALVTPDNFAPFALAAAGSLWAAGRGLRDGRPAWFGLAGLAAGLGHLARADGVLLAGVALAAAVAARPGKPWATVGAALAGYLAAMAPWFVRNWLVAGTPLPAAGAQTMWLTSYDDLFAWGRPATLDRYLAWGWPAILRSKGEALAANTQRLWVENLLIVLPPLTGIGLWRMRKDRRLWPFFLYAPLLFLAMTLVFTFPGPRGALYHSGGALLPFFFAAAGPGLDAALRWVSRRVPRWHAGRAWRVFGAGLVALAVLVTALAVWRAGIVSSDWARRGDGYRAVGRWLDGEGVPAGTVVMGGNAPGLTWATGRPAIAVPNDPVDVIVAVARRYGARYLVLDDARPRTTDGLFAGQAVDPRLALRHAADSDGKSWQVYEIVQP